MLIREAIGRVKQLYNKGSESHDSNLANRYVYSKLKTVRERVLSQEVKKKQYVNAWSYQTISCLELMIVPSHECLCVPYEDCEILRTKKPLPPIFTDADRHIIKSVTKITGTGPNFLDLQFDEINWMRVKYNGGYQFGGKKKLMFYIQDGYLYIVNNDKLKLISITALFEDPLEAELAAQTDYCGENKDHHYPEPCKAYLDYDLHIDGKLAEAVIGLTAEEIIYIYAQMRKDIRNDDMDGTGANIENPRSYRNIDKNVNRN